MCAARTATNAKMQLTEIRNTESSTQYTSFDARGRLTAMQQKTPAASTSPNTMSYSYDLASHPTSITYPSGKVVAQKFDTAGRTTEVTGYTSATTSISYAAHGALKSMTLGNGLVLQWTYDSARLQPQQMQVNSATGRLGHPDLAAPRLFVMRPTVEPSSALAKNDPLALAGSNPLEEQD